MKGRQRINYEQMPARLPAGTIAKLDAVTVGWRFRNEATKAAALRVAIDLTCWLLAEHEKGSKVARRVVNAFNADRELK